MEINDDQDDTVTESVSQVFQNFNDRIDELCALLLLVEIAGRAGKRKDGFVTLVLDECTFSDIQRALKIECLQS